MTSHRARALGSCVGLAALVGACFDPPGDSSLDPTLAMPGTTGPIPDPTSEGSEDTGTATSESADTTAGGTASEPDGSTGPSGPVCGNGVIEEGEECDDGNPSDTDACPRTCMTASCGDGFVHAGVEICDDGNAIETDDCLSTCVPASCGDGFVHAGVEGCDDGNAIETDDCLSTCVPASCGDGFVHEGIEECDDGGVVGGDGCGATCLAECGNPGGGALSAENGTGTGVMYCYAAADTTEVRAQKACESHFGVGGCCIITGGYQDQQYGQCGFGGEAGTLHWHWDFHPAGHCEPFYVPGDVVSPGWCGGILGSFLD
jgi:cysteine-rich repeat protein